MGRAADAEPAPGVTGLVGDNGVGKSVLLSIAAGAVQPSSGNVLCTGTLRAVGQHPPGATLAALAGLDRELEALWRLECGQGTAEDLLLADGRWDWPARWRQALEDAGLGHLQGDADANHLSGGERVRVALAGAFFSQAEVLLLDEPTSALDLRWQLTVLQTVRALVDGGQTLALIAVHDLNLALRFCDRILVLGQGRILADGVPADVVTPQLLQQAYGVRARVERCSRGHPVVLADEALALAGAAAIARAPHPHDTAFS
ncbi:ABC transporter ATP-binding protein [Paracidovorax cattleyae]|uniref:ABC transporter ATP-binding protein n=1 Tax=Paracidovorax cattleyae TaxID=80868 RepID=UPI00336A301B